MSKQTETKSDTGCSLQRLVRAIGRDQAYILKIMVNPEYPSKYPDSRALRVLKSLKDKRLVYDNYGIWRRTSLGEQVCDLLP